MPIPPRIAETSWEEFWNGRLEKAVENLVVLRVTTVVGTVNAKGADDFDQVTGLTLAQGDQQVCSTSINMLLGDCSLILSQVFVDNAAYKQLHADAVTQAKEVRQQTITLLKEAFDAFKDKLFASDGRGTGNSRSTTICLQSADAGGQYRRQGQRHIGGEDAIGAAARPAFADR